MQYSVTNKKRPLNYAIILTIGFIFLSNILHNSENENFFYTAVAILYLVLVFELIITRYYAKVLLKQYALPPLAEKDSLAQIIQHIFLPSLIYLSLASYLFFHRQPSLQIIIYIIVFLSFWVLFTNIRAYYEDKFKLEQTTHNIYDIITILTAYLAFDSLLNIFLSNNYSLSLIFFPFTAVAALLFLLALIRDKIKFNLITIVTLAVIAGAIGVIFTNLGLAEFAIAFLLTQFFYYVLAFTHHYNEGSANLKIFTEYFIIFLISLVILFGIK